MGWKAMLYAMRNPAECGLKVDNVVLQDKPGFMQRSMRLLEKPGSPTMIDNLRVIESAKEITYRTLVNGVESQEEKVFALRKDPLRFEMFCRNAGDSMRLDWQAPRSICTVCSTRRQLRRLVCRFRAGLRGLMLAHC